MKWICVFDNVEMCLRWNEYVYLMMWKYGFDNVRIRARWIGPYAWRSVSWLFLGCSLHIHGTFVMRSLSVRYISAKQKYGFCRVKVWFLACKKWVFALQKYGFCFLNVTLLQIGRNAFRGWMWISHRMFAILFQFASSVVGRPLAAVGADSSCPHIRKCPQNGGQKCIYD